MGPNTDREQQQQQQRDDDDDVVEKVLRLYGDLSGELHLVELDRRADGAAAAAGGGTTVGLCLAGNRDLATMSVFVVGYQPGSVAANDTRIHIGDQLLEVTNQPASSLYYYSLYTLINPPAAAAAAVWPSSSWWCHGCGAPHTARSRPCQLAV